MAGVLFLFKLQKRQQLRLSTSCWFEKSQVIMHPVAAVVKNGALWIGKDCNDVSPPLASSTSASNTIPGS